jgi:hypothetical protein
LDQVEDTVRRASPAESHDLAESQTDERPRAFDVNALVSDEGPVERSVVEDLIAAGSTITLAGEEGEGKTLVAEHIIRQELRGDRVLDHFDTGAIRVERALFLDTEMEQEDARVRSADSVTRGLELPNGTMFWLHNPDLNLAESEEDRAYLEEEIRRVRAGFLWIDTGGNAVGDPNDNVQVREFFNYLPPKEGGRRGRCRPHPPATEARPG